MAIRTPAGKGLIDAHAITSPEIAFWLRGELGRPVIDKTGLKGKYDFKLEWTPDESQPNADGTIPPLESDKPSVFAALKQLGLELHGIRAPVEVLVIDHAEKPSAN